MQRILECIPWNIMSRNVSVYLVKNSPENSLDLHFQKNNKNSNKVNVAFSSNIITI